MSITVNNASSVKTSQPLSFGENQEKKGMTLIGSGLAVGAGAGAGYVASAVMGVSKDKVTDAVKKQVNEFGDSFETAAKEIQGKDDDAKKSVISKLSEAQKKFAGIDDNTKVEEFEDKLQKAGAKAVKAGTTDKNLEDAIKSAEKNAKEKKEALDAIQEPAENATDDVKAKAKEAKEAAKKEWEDAEYNLGRKKAARDAKDVPSIDDAVKSAMDGKTKDLEGDKKIFVEMAEDAKKSLKNGRNWKAAGGAGLLALAAYGGYKYLASKE